MRLTYVSLAVVILVVACSSDLPTYEEFDTAEIVTTQELMEWLGCSPVVTEFHVQGPSPTEEEVVAAANEESARNEVRYHAVEARLNGDVWVLIDRQGRVFGGVSDSHGHLSSCYD